MNVSYADEVLDGTLIAEIDSLLKAYYEATVAKEGIPPFDHRWEVYLHLQKQGALRISTARVSVDGIAGALIGISMYIVTEHLHHRGWMIAEADTLAVDYNFRQHGIGTQLLKHTIDRVAGEGVHTIVNRHRACYDDTPLFEKLGYSKSETVYTLDVGER